MNYSVDDFVAAFVSKTVQAVEQFRIDHSDEIVATFAFFEDCANGVFAAGFDTVDNSLLHAKRREKYVANLRKQEALKHGAGFADKLVRDPRFLRIDDFNTSIGRMKYPGVFNEYVGEWVDNPSVSDGVVYLACVAIADQLIKKAAFSVLRLASPFRIGFSSLERDDMIVIAMLNWPPHVGPRV